MGRGQGLTDGSVGDQLWGLRTSTVSSADLLSASTLTRGSTDDFQGTVNASTAQHHALTEYLQSLPQWASTYPTDTSFFALEDGDSALHAEAGARNAGRGGPTSQSKKVVDSDSDDDLLQALCGSLHLDVFDDVDDDGADGECVAVQGASNAVDGGDDGDDGDDALLAQAKARHDSVQASTGRLDAGVWEQGVGSVPSARSRNNNASSRESSPRRRNSSASTAASKSRRSSHSATLRPLLSAGLRKETDSAVIMVRRCRGVGGWVGGWVWMGLWFCHYHCNKEKSEQE